ncbi:metal ABC transporter solute-binding protein, Zn/Mn family [Chloroflexota bacterium]
MRSNHILRLVLLSLTLVLLAAAAISCSGEPEGEDVIGVVVTIPPQAELVERVGGGRVAVTVMVPAGASPHTYEPTASQMVALEGAKMYAEMGSGVEFELAWMDRIEAANGDMLVVDCSRGIDVEGNDPHIWMSPLNAEVIVRNICRGLTEVDPDGRAYYQGNRDRYLEELAQLDWEISERLSGAAGRMFIVYHPSLGYLAREYDLTMLPIEEEGKEPTGAEIASLVEQAEEFDIEVIFASPQFNPRNAEVIAGEIGGRVVFVDPLARDYIANLRFLLSELAQAVE